MIRVASPLALLAALAVTVTAAPDVAELNALSRTGVTLPLEATQHFPLPEVPVPNDTGINVLIDLAHQANFLNMWKLPGGLRKSGIRAVGSMAALDSVLPEGSTCRVRIPLKPAEKRLPFGWVPAPRFNVVLSIQGNANGHAYLPAERQALKTFIDAGGGLILVGGRVMDDAALATWPLNSLAQEYGAEFLAESDKAGRCSGSALKLGPGWKTRLEGAAGKPMIAEKTVGKGRVIIISTAAMINLRDKKATAEQKKSMETLLADAAKWAAAGAPPVGGTTALPRERAGGGPIYPEMERRVGNVIVYYAKNQKQELLDCVDRDMPKAKAQVEAWLPSVPSGEPMYVITGNGGGGGWAVNAYFPKEAGTLSMSPASLLSVFGHELAHTMGGPRNDAGRICASWPQGNQGESHAGWFQGKVIAMFSEEARKQSNRRCNRVIENETKTGKSLDVAKGGRGGWSKMWYVWNKLDDRYGPTWYPRWRWVQSVRWTDAPGRKLTWDETVEDMSIACGEDLFPFFKRLGTTLNKDRFPQATFRGQTLPLSIADLDPTPAGPVCLDPIGDYKQPLKPAGR